MGPVKTSMLRLGSWSFTLKKSTPVRMVMSGLLSSMFSKMRV